MKHNIISVSSIAILTGSFTAAGILSGTIPTLGQVVAVIVVTLIGAAGAWVTYPCRCRCKEKPLTSGDSVKGTENFTTLF